MSWFFLLIFSILTFLIGWFLGVRRVTNENTRIDRQLSRDYFVGLNYLLNEQQDKAVDIFIKMLEVDNDTVETHLALGNLFRRRGEVDRAIRIHQNLIARPQLNKLQRIHALLELGQDYMRAGVLDRAERLFLEVVETGEQQVSALTFLLDIYEQEKDWEKAIKVAERLENFTGQSMRQVIAHYYCELAENARAKSSIEQAYNLLKRALVIDKNSVRASLMQADLDCQIGREKQAIKLYQRVNQQDPDFLSEMVEPLTICYQRLGDDRGLMDFLQRCADENPRISVVIALAELLKRKYDDVFAGAHLGQHLKQYPSLKGLHHLIEMQTASVDEHSREHYTLLQDIIMKLLENKPVYRCHSCGFSGRKLHWQCPSCKKWSVMKPIHGIEGE